MGLDYWNAMFWCLGLVGKFLISFVANSYIMYGILEIDIIH